MPEPGARISGIAAEQDTRLDILAAGTPVATFTVGPRYERLRLRAGERNWEITRYARGWSLALRAEDGRTAASYSQPWVLPGRLTIGRTDLTAHVPVVWRPWRFKCDGRRILDLDVGSRGDVAGTLHEIPPDTDAVLLTAFATTVVWLRSQMPALPGGVAGHFGGGDGGDAGGGGGDGGGGGGGA